MIPSIITVVMFAVAAALHSVVAEEQAYGYGSSSDEIGIISFYVIAVIVTLTTWLVWSLFA